MRGNDGVRHSPIVADHSVREERASKLLSHRLHHAVRSSILVGVSAKFVRLSMDLVIERWERDTGRQSQCKSHSIQSLHVVDHQTTLQIYHLRGESLRGAATSSA
jgi:hypothetical protein